MNEVEIYVDGACSGNPGSGGWAALLIFGTHRKLIGGHYARETNQRMEILAAVHGLQALKWPCKVTIYSDSQYLVNCMTGDFKRHSNLDLWEQIDTVAQGHDIEWVWVRGHSGNDGNEIVNEEAQRRARNGRK